MWTIPPTCPLMLSDREGISCISVGSGNVGARNGGRLRGAPAFAAIFLGDALKGASVILLGRYLNYAEPLLLLGLGFAIIGHIKPITLKFKGGKGVSTFIGGMLALEPWLAFVIIISFLVLYPFTKSFTLSGLGAFLAIPATIMIKSGNWLSCVISLSLCCFGKIS